MRAMVAPVPSRAPGRAVLKVQGALDLASVDHVTAELRKVEDSPEVVLDLRDVTFLDSSGLAALVHFEARMRMFQRTFALVIGSGQVRNLFELTGLLDEMLVVSSLSQLPSKAPDLSQP